MRVNRNMICITEIETVFEIFLSLLSCSKTVFFKMSLFYFLYAARAVTFFHVVTLRLNIIIPLFQVNILLRLQHWFGITQWWLDAIRKGQVTAGYGVKSFCEQAGSSNICRSFFLVFSFSTGLRKSRLNSYAGDTLSNTVAWVLAVGRHLGIS